MQFKLVPETREFHAVGENGKMHHSSWNSIYM